ncbi:MAG: NAD-dependent epimerase/dehydratase family protein [Erythrobacter sp.]
MSDRGAVLVTGANGFVGRAVIAHLLRWEGRGERPVFAGLRDTACDVPEGAGKLLMGDLAAPGGRAAVLAGVDCVVHCAARAHILSDDAADPLAVFRTVNRDATLALARDAAEAGVRRFVFISSIGVNGTQTRGTPSRYDDPPAPASPYAVAKHEAEEGLTVLMRETGLECVVIRPPLVRGPEAPGNLGRLQALLASGVPVPFASITENARDFVSRDNLASLIATTIDHPAAPSQTFLASDGASLSTVALLREEAARLGVSCRLFPFPPGLLKRALASVGRGAMAEQLLGDLTVDVAHTRETLGWNPEVQE